MKNFSIVLNRFSVHLLHESKKRIRSSQHGGRKKERKEKKEEGDGVGG